MQLPFRFGASFRIVALAAVYFVPAIGSAHFILTSPPAMTEQGPLGDPQKAPPCGDDGTAVATRVVTPVNAGDTITITIDETIYHPGHYRVAIAGDPNDLPDVPEVAPGPDSPCGTADIMDPAVYPVLADGMLVHDQGFAGPQTIEVTIPEDVTCTTCTLQVIQFMSQHGLNNPGGCYYHHCAVLEVANGGATASATDGGSADGTSAGSAGETSDGGPAGSTGAGDSGAAETAASTLPGGGDGSGGAGGSSGDGTGGAPADEESGCGCSTTEPRGLLGAVVFLGVGLIRRRRVR